MLKKMIVFLDEFFEEIKTTEDLIDNNKEKAVNKDYVDGFKDCLEKITRKAMEIACELEMDNHDLENMEPQSNSIH